MVDDRGVLLAYLLLGDGKKEKNAHAECRVQKNTQKVILQQWHPVVIFAHSAVARKPQKVRTSLGITLRWPRRG